MKFRILNLLLVAILVSGILLASAQTVSSVQAQSGFFQAGTPSPSDDTIYLYQLKQTDIQLRGPYDSASVSFDLPAEWKLTKPAELFLDLTVSLSLFVDSGSAPLSPGAGGSLSVEFNREVVGTFPLNQNGDVTVRVPIPIEQLTPIRDDGRQELIFVLDSGFSCLVNQQMTVVVNDSSGFIFPHETTLPDINLARFPFPIYQDSIFNDGILIVIPDQPAPEELQSAMTVAAGLGRLTGLNASLDLAAMSKVTPEQLAANHLVLVGKSASLSLADKLKLPLALQAGKFQASGGDENDGIIQMVHSPWSDRHVVLLVSGTTEIGVLKAAQAVSTGVLRANIAPNVSVVQDVQGNVQQPSQGSDVTLSGLGYTDTTLQRRGVASVAYQFYIPPDRVLSPDAYFELVYGNSALLNYARSGLVVQINGQPVGSVRFSDITASQTTNRVQISVPPSIVVSGINKLEIISSLQPIDNCSVPTLRGMWTNIWSESRLHLPLITMPIEVAPVFDLGDFPAPLTLDPSLGTTAFVLQRNDLDSWRSALQIAAYLGDRSNGSISLLQTYYADAVPESARASLNFVVIGMPSQMPIVSELNNFLPVPFELKSGIANERNMQVKYRIPASSPIGYVELLTSPWSQSKVIIAALGNLKQGVAWGASALYTSSLRSRLSGNFAAINDQQVVSADTRITTPAEIPSSQPAVEATPASTDTQPQAGSRPVWILPALSVTVMIIVLILFWVFYNMFVRDRKQGMVKVTDVGNDEDREIGREK